MRGHRQEVAYCGRMGRDAILGVRTSIWVHPLSCTSLSWLTHSSSLLSTAAQPCTISLQCREATQHRDT